MKISADVGIVDVKGRKGYTNDRFNKDNIFTRFKYNYQSSC